MKIARYVISTALAALALLLPANSAADRRPGSVEILQRGPDGRATMVRVDGRDYPVCLNDQQDSCIAPYAAGLRWGNRPLHHWPGRPASELREEGIDPSR